VKLFYAGWHDAVGIEVARKYLTCVRLLRDYKDASQDPMYSAVRSPVSSLTLLFLTEIRYAILENSSFMSSRIGTLPASHRQHLSNTDCLEGWREIINCSVRCCEA